MVADPIADFITRIKNAGDVGKEVTVIPFSKMKMAIAEILQKEGYVKAVTKKGKKVKKYIEVELLYRNSAPRIAGVQRVSKLSKRVYLGVKDIKPVKQGNGLLVISTPMGVITDREAKTSKVGGEALFKIW